MNQNYVRIGGGLTKDPHYQTTRNDNQMVGLTVAVNGARYDGESRQQVVTTQFISVVAFGEVADQIMSLRLGRGDSVMIEGSLSQEEVEVDGKKNRKTRVEAWGVRVTRRSNVVRVASGPTGPPPSPGPPDPWGQVPTYDEPPF